ncbi:hypothetical protein ACFFWC_11920, partial [Plantactinospora siamensis]
MLTILVTQVVALTVNAASGERRWAWGLDVVQRYPFPSLLVGTVLLLVLAVSALSVQRSRDTSPAVSMPNDVPDSASIQVHAEPVRTGMVDPPMGELPVVVRGREAMVGDVLAPVTPGSGVRVVAGMGGCGKTTVALAAAGQAWAAGWRVWWVSAVDRPSLVAGMSAVAREAGASAQEVTEADSGLALAGVVWRWLERVSDRWLLVVDNADDPAVLAPGGTSVAGGGGWLRSAGDGVVLVTTRVADRRVWGHRVGWFPLGELDQRSAALMVLDRMGRTDEPGLMGAAVAVADRLGRLPLAVHLAGSYLGSGLAAVGLDGYLRLLTDRSLSLVDEGAPGWGERDPRRLVMSTWEISLDALERQGRVRARTVLRVLSYLAPGSVVPVSMLDPAVLADAGLLSGGEEGRAELAAGLSGLRAVGVVEGLSVSADAGDGLLVHPLVAEVCRWWADRDGPRTRLMTAAAGLVVTAKEQIDPADPADWDAWQVLAPHSRQALDLINELDDELSARVFGLNNALTRHFTARGSYPAAIESGEAIVAAATARLGAEHPDTLTSRNNLA